MAKIEKETTLILLLQLCGFQKEINNKREIKDFMEIGHKGQSGVYKTSYKDTVVA